MLCNLNSHLKLHSDEIDENKSSHDIIDHQIPEKDSGKLPVVSNKTNNNTGSDSRMLRMSLLTTDPGQGEIRTMREQETWKKSPIIKQNSDDKFSSKQSYSAPYKRNEHDSPCGQRKRFKCGDCDYQTTSKVSMDLHVELMHSIAAVTTLQPTITTTIEGEFHCAICPFKAQSQAALEQHAADYRYPMGVYSVDALGNLNHRLKSHPGEKIEDNNKSEQQNGETDEAENDSTLGHLGHCFELHSGESIEDSSSCHQNAEIDDRSLPVLSNNSSTGYESKMRKQFGIKECRVTLRDTHSSSAEVVNPVNIELLPFEEDQSQTEDASNVSMDMHIESIHPICASSQSPRKEKFQLHCSHCPFKARNKRAFEQHNTCHNRNQAARFQCPLCSFSVDSPWHLNCHLKVHSEEIGEGNTNNIGDHQNAEKDRREIPVSKTNGNTGSETMMMTNRTEQGKTNNDQIDTNQSNPAALKRKEKWNSSPCKKKHMCGDCKYQTTFKVSMDMHIELMHPITATALPPPKSGEDNKDISDHQTARILPALTNIINPRSEAMMREQFGIKECYVTLRDINSSFAKAVNPENMELLPFEEKDEIADDVAIDDGKIQSVERLKIMEERARISDDEIKEIPSKKMDVHKRIIEMAGVRLLTEYDLRVEQRNLLEMSIAALDAEEDRSQLMEPVNKKIQSLEKKIGAIDDQVEALKAEQSRLAHKI